MSIIVASERLREGLVILSVGGKRKDIIVSQQNRWSHGMMDERTSEDHPPMELIKNDGTNNAHVVYILPSVHLATRKHTP